MSLSIGNGRMTADGYTPAPSSWEARDFLAQTSRSGGSAPRSAEVPHRRVAEIDQVPITAAAPTSGRELAVAAVAKLAALVDEADRLFNRL